MSGMRGNMLITGGAGFIGINTALFFVKKGWNVTIFDNFSRRGTDIHRDLLNAAGVGICVGDVRTDVALLKTLSAGSDVIIHLAAQVAVTTSVHHPREDFDINALGTFNVLEAARAAVRPPIVLYASTNKVYGGLEQIPTQEQERRYDFVTHNKGIDEQVALDFHSPYGCSKGAADQYVRDYARIYGLQTVVIRQSCIYGPHQFGIEDQGWVAWFMIAGLLGKPVTVYGNGKQVRDLLNVADLVALYERAIDAIAVARGQVYNAGGGMDNTVSLLEFLDILRNDLQLPLTPTFADWRPGDQPIFVSDNSKAERELGWRPTIGVRTGFRELADWLKQHRSHIASLYA